MTDSLPVESDELGVIEDARVRQVRYRDTVIEVRPLTVAQLPRFARAARPVLEELWREVDADDEKTAVVDPARVFDWLERFPPQLTEAAAAATGHDPEWIAGAELDQFAELVMAVLSINLDFFVRRLLPTLAVEGRDVVRQIARRTNGSGLTPSSFSSSTATP